MELEVTWGRAIKVWWAMLWRSTLLIFVFGTLVGFVTGMLGTLLGINDKAGAIISGSLGFLLGAYIGVYVIKLILNKKFKGFRIALVANESEGGKENA